MYWSNSGFENNTLAGLIKTTAAWHVEGKHKYADDDCLMQHLSDREEHATACELINFNEDVKAKIEELETEIHLNRSNNQKLNDYMADCADNNWKERE